MKKLLGILGTAAGAGLLGLGIFNLVKKEKDIDVDECDYNDFEETEVDDEVESEEE
jgi:hypothetical protein